MLTSHHYVTIRGRKYLFSLIVAFLLIGGACSSEGDKKEDQPTPNDFNLEAHKKITMKLQWPTPPVASQFLSLVLQFSGPEGTDFSQLQVSRFKPWMTSMGHGGYDDEQKITKNPKVSSEFIIENVYFTMPGKWDVEVSAMLGSQTFQLSSPIDVAAE